MISVYLLLDSSVAATVDRATGITPAMYQKIACEDAGAPR